MSNIVKTTDPFFTRNYVNTIRGTFRGGIKINGYDWYRRPRVTIGRGRLGNPNPRHKFQPGNTWAKKQP